MAKLTNRVTGQTYPATVEQVAAVRENPMTKDLFDVTDTPVPEEVTRLKDKDTAKEETK